MATTITKFPVTLQERAELGSTPYPMEATLEAFGELLEVCEYQIEYQNGNIIAMSIASDSHEQIVANLLYVLGVIFKGNADFKRYGSNRHIYLEADTTVFSPDASVVKGDPKIIEYAKGKTANQNPWLVAEILSPSTRNRDWGEKLTLYKNISSLKYILYIEQDTPLVTVFERRETDGRWTALDYNALDQSFTIANSAISLGDLYENVIKI